MRAHASLRGTKRILNLSRSSCNPLFRLLSTKEAQIDHQDGSPTSLQSKRFAVDRDASFLHGDNVSFQSCGCAPELVTALDVAGFRIPTVIQVKAFAAVNSGADIIIGAETGSGKTFSYLIPIADMLIRRFIENEAKGEQVLRSFPTVVVIVPNKELCKQVTRMANQFLKNLPRNFGVSVGSFTNIAEKWQYAHSQSSPAIAVCTPAFLANFVKGPNILEEDLFGGLEHIVLDEADMLLDGSYKTDMDKILTACKVARRNMVKKSLISADAKPLRKIIVAATLPSHGLKSIETDIAKRFPKAIRVTNDYFHKHHPCIEQTFVKIYGGLLSGVRVELIVKAIKEGGTNVELDATSNELDETAIKLDGNQDSTGPIIGDKQIQTMVFVNTAKETALLSTALREKGVECAEYHKYVTDPVREENLQLFRDGKVHVLVCTDHASRGLDIPNVRHVIQAEFATNVVKYLHRIGRASRAGVIGNATNIYDARSELLVMSILSDEDNKSVSQSFSRRRGFRNRVKKELNSVSEPDSVGHLLGDTVDRITQDGISVGEVDIINKSNTNNGEKFDSISPAI